MFLPYIEKARFQMVFKTFLFQNDKLVEAFGSARQKRSLQARKKNLISKDEVSEKVLEVTEQVKSVVSPREEAGKNVETICFLLFS